MGVDIRVRRFAQSDAERTLMHTIDKGNRAPLANALSNYYKKLKADEKSITKEDLEELLRAAFHISIRQASRKLDLLDKYQAFKGKHLYNMRETHPNTATLKHLHAQARQELGEVAEPHGNLQNLLASYRNEYEALSRQIHAYGGNPDDPEVLEMAARYTSLQGSIEHIQKSIDDIKRHMQALDANITTLEININQLEALGRIANSASTASSIADSLGGEDASRNIKKLESQLEAAAEIASESPEERELTNLVLVEKVKQIKGMNNG